MEQALKIIDYYLQTHTQRELANKLGVSDVTASRWVSTRKIHPAYVKLIKERLPLPGAENINKS